MVLCALLYEYLYCVANQDCVKLVGLCTLVTMNFVNVTQSSTSGEPNNSVSTLKVLTRDEVIGELTHAMRIDSIC